MAALADWELASDWDTSSLSDLLASSDLDLYSDLDAAASESNSFCCSLTDRLVLRLVETLTLLIQDSSSLVSTI